MENKRNNLKLASIITLELKTKGEKMKKKLTLIMFLAIATFMSLGYSGWHQNQEVSSSGRWAHGSIRAASESNDNYQFIGCHATFSENSEVICSAQNSNKVRTECHSDQKWAFKALYSMTSLSYLEFDSYSNGECKYIKVYNYSLYD